MRGNISAEQAQEQEVHPYVRPFLLYLSCTSDNNAVRSGLAPHMAALIGAAEEKLSGCDSACQLVSGNPISGWSTRHAVSILFDHSTHIALY